MTEPILEPDLHEVLQEELADTLTAIPVEVRCVDGPVRVQLLPDKGASTRTRTVTTAPVRVLTADPRRKSAVLMSMDENLLVAYSQAAATDTSSMAVWPKLVPLAVPATVEVWVATGTGSSAVSIQTFRWAE